MIPYRNYGFLHGLLKKEILDEIQKVLSFSDNWQHEKYVEEFEKKFAEFIGVKYAIGADSGTTALQLVLTALGVEEKDEVIMPVYTYISTALAILNIRAKPVFVEVKKDLTIDCSKI